MSTLTAHDATHLLPRSPLTGARWLWSRVIFPERSTEPTALRPRSLALVILLPALLLYPSLNFHLMEPDESRYAEIPREMLQRGDWVVPHLQGQPYLDKPPLMYWLVMLSYSIFGVHEWAARVVPALAIHVSILATYLVGRRSLGERPAFWGAMLLSAAPGFMSMGRILILDGLLACCTTVAILAAWEALRGQRLAWGWWLLAAAATGLGILTKGPVALILLVPPLWLYRRLHGASSKMGIRPVITFLAASAAINVPWYLAIGLRAPAFLRYFFWEHNVVRFVAPFDHIRPVWFYIPVLLLGLLPGTLMIVTLARDLLSGEPRRARGRTPELGFFLLAGGWCVLFFSMSGSKLPTYILPAFPMLALAFGSTVVAGGVWRTRVAAALIVVASLFLGWLHVEAFPWYAKMRSPMRDPARVAKYCADPEQPVVCFPRSCDSVAFYLERDDLRNIRTKNSNELIETLRMNPRTVILFTHRHSLDGLRTWLPADLVIVEEVAFDHDKSVGKWYDILSTETPWGLCDLAVIERRP